jgi:hypothetical protein
MTQKTGKIQADLFLCRFWPMFNTAESKQLQKD